MDSAERKGVAVLVVVGVAAFAWWKLSNKFLPAAAETITDVIADLPGSDRIENRVRRGPLGVCPASKTGEWQEGWFGKWRVHEQGGEPFEAAGMLEFDQAQVVFPSGPEQLLRGDPLALHYFGHAVCNLSNFDRVYLSGHAYREDQWLQADCFRYGYGFEFMSPADGRRFVLRAVDMFAVEWLYALRAHYQEPGRAREDWLTAAGSKYLVMIDRAGRWGWE